MKGYWDGFLAELFEGHIWNLEGDEPLFLQDLSPRELLKAFYFWLKKKADSPYVNFSCIEFNNLAQDKRRLEWLMEQFRRGSCCCNSDQFPSICTLSSREQIDEAMEEE